MKFQQDKLTKLKQCMRKEEVQEWQSPKTANRFVDMVFRNGTLSELKTEVCAANFGEKKLYRSDVWNFVCRNNTTTLEKVLFVLAWGGMIPRNVKYALNSYRDCWETIVNAMLNGIICREEAYKQFHSLVKYGQLKGMGPAYFTKLIYFLERKHNGYIMDQWTARSMNLLRKSGASRVHLIPAGTRNNGRFRKFRVHPKKNTPAVYRTFCNDLESLAKTLNKKPEETEKLIFSKGGRLENMGCWRRYVLEETS